MNEEKLQELTEFYQLLTSFKQQLIGDYSLVELDKFSEECELGFAKLRILTEDENAPAVKNVLAKIIELYSEISSGLEMEINKTKLEIIRTRNQSITSGSYGVSAEPDAFFIDKLK